MSSKRRSGAWRRTALLGVVAVLVLAWGIVREMQLARASEEPRPAVNRAPWSEQAMEDWRKPPEEELRRLLTDLQYRVTQKDATERAFRNEYWNEKEHGIYVDVVSGEPLFSSLDKYDSGTGWPSFLRPLEPANLAEDTDYKLGYPRTEVRSRTADSHLGHLFPDGPEPTGDRYCINSAALRFVPVSRLETEGYGKYTQVFRAAGVDVPVAANVASGSGSGSAAVGTPARVMPGWSTDVEGAEIAILAGGCYWGMEDLIRDLPGVLDTEVGFSGGTLDRAKYEDLRKKDTGHAESVRVVFDPAKLSYADLLDFFFRIHDPTTRDRQGNDRGAQYRSEIFVADEGQRKTAERVKAEWDASKRWKRPIVTEITAAGPFWPAKEDHQDYLEKIPNGYTCHFLREWDE